LISDSEYTLRLGAHNNFSIGNSYNNPNWSSSVTVYSCILPQTVDKLRVDLVTRNSEIISWDLLKTQEASGYSTTAVEYCLEMGDDAGTNIEIFRTTSNYNVIVPITGSSFSIWMRCKNSIGYSDYSATTLQLFAEKPTAPDPPRFK